MQMKFLDKDCNYFACINLNAKMSKKIINKIEN